MALAPAQRALLPAGRRLYLQEDFGLLCDGSDETAKYQAVLNCLLPGDVLHYGPRLGLSAQCVAPPSDAVYHAGLGAGATRWQETHTGLGGPTGMSGTRIEALGGAGGFTGGPPALAVHANSNGADVSTWTPAALGTMRVQSNPLTSGYSPSGYFYVATAQGVVRIDYDGITPGAPSTFDNCAALNIVNTATAPTAGATVATGGAINGPAYLIVCRRPLTNGTFDRPLAHGGWRDMVIDGADANGVAATRAGGLPVGGFYWSSFRGRLYDVFVNRMSGVGMFWRGNDLAGNGGDPNNWHGYGTNFANVDIGFCGEEGMSLWEGAVDLQAVLGNIYNCLIGMRIFGASAFQFSTMQLYSALWQNMLIDKGGSRGQFGLIKNEEPKREGLKVDANRGGSANISFDGGRFKSCGQEADNAYPYIALVGPANKGTGTMILRGLDFDYDAGGGPNKATAFITLGATGQRTFIQGCQFGDGKVAGNSHLSASGPQIPLVDANALNASSAICRGNYGVPDNNHVVLRHAVADVNVTIQQTDDYVAYTTLTASRVVTLAAPTGQAGSRLSIKDETGLCAAGRTITITPAGGATIDGAANLVLNTAYASVSLVTDGTNWFTVV